MLFKDSDVERKFFQLFLFDEGEDKDEDEEDNIVDKPLIKWTRAPKTVARARKEIVDLIDDETKNKLRIVSVSTPLEKCHKIEATCDVSNGEVYRVSVQLKTNTSFGGGLDDDDEDKILFFPSRRRSLLFLSFSLPGKEVVVKIIIRRRRRSWRFRF